MPTLLLIRHGENDYVKQKRLPGHLSGIHLNKKGRVQAAQLAEALKATPLAAIYSSPLERAVETAEPIARAVGLQLQTLPGLIEIDIGEWEGAKLRKLSKLPEWRLVQHAPSRFQFPGGDSFAERQARLVAEVERIIHLHEPEDIVALVFHADPIKLVLAYYMGMPLDFFQRLACGTGSVSVLVLSEAGSMLSRLNMQPPFEIPAPPAKKDRRKSR